MPPLSTITERADLNWCWLGNARVPFSYMRLSFSSNYLNRRDYVSRSIFKAIRLARRTNAVITLYSIAALVTGSTALGVKHG